MVARLPLQTDALIIGAGPVGLFQIFQLGLLEIHAQVIDALPYPGGQCSTLYADKPIYDIPGLPVCSGQELIDRLLEQIRPFEPRFHFRQTITSLQYGDDGRFHLESSSGQTFVAKVVFIAAGVGAFLPRRLNLPGIEGLIGQQVFEGSLPPMGSLSRPAAQSKLVVIGGDRVAIEQSLAALAQWESVILMHRRDHFTAPPALIDALAKARLQGQVQFVAGQAVGLSSHEGQLTQLQFTSAQGELHCQDLDYLVTCLGLSPQLGPLADWGLDLVHKQVLVDPVSYQTRYPGLYAVGDINTYPGKKKLILCGFHEATLAAHHAARHLHPHSPQGPLLYTTSSPKLQRLLGRLAGPKN